MFILNPYRYAAPGGGLTLPSDIPTLQVGYESDFGLYSDAAGTTPQSTHAGAIRHWKPIYGSGNCTRVGGNGPTLDTGTTLNGIQTIKFVSASTQDLDLPNIFGALTSGELMMGVKMAADPGVGSAVGFIYMGKSNHNSHYPFTNSLIYDGYGATGRKDAISKGANNLAAWHEYNPYSAPSDWDLKINGASLSGFPTATNNVAFPDGAPFVGAIGRSFSADGTNYMSGWIAYFYHFSAKLTAPQRAFMNSYRLAKWGF